MADIDYRTYVDKVVDGRWRLVRFIGKGGFGAVFEAVREGGVQKQRRALKLLKPDAPTSVRQRFAREFRLTDVAGHVVKDILA